MTCQLLDNVYNETKHMVFHTQIQHDTSVKLAIPYFLWERIAVVHSAFPVHFPKRFRAFPFVSERFRMGMTAETLNLFFSDMRFLRVSSLLLKLKKGKLVHPEHLVTFASQD